MAFKMHRTTGTVGECVDEFVALKDVAMVHGRLSKNAHPLVYIRRIHSTPSGASILGPGSRRRNRTSPKRGKGADAWLGDARWRAKFGD